MSSTSLLNFWPLYWFIKSLDNFSLKGRRKFGIWRKKSSNDHWSRTLYNKILHFTTNISNINVSKKNLKAFSHQKNLFSLLEQLWMKLFLPNKRLIKFSIEERWEIHQFMRIRSANNILEVWFFLEKKEDLRIFLESEK